MRTPRSGHTAVRLLDGRVLVVGGANGDANDTSAELYDAESGTWSATRNMLKPHAGFRATLLRDGRVLYMLERTGIENRDAPAIAAELTAAFDKFCAAPTTA